MKECMVNFYSLPWVSQPQLFSSVPGNHPRRLLPTDRGAGALGVLGTIGPLALSMALLCFTMARCSAPP
jgi:hypothetical protein